MGPSVDGYERLELIGRGGFSSVYRAFQPAFGRWVALKILDADALDEVTGRTFARECQLAGRLTGHPHVVTILESGTTDDRRPFLSMPYYDGGSLSAYLATAGSVDPRDVTELGIKLASALESAHRSGSLHRDVKPGNILFTNNGDVALTDFGIGALVGSTMSSGDATYFTVAFAAPEVLQDLPATTASDVYSLGMTLYTCLAGGNPFLREDLTTYALMHRVVEQRVPFLDRAFVDDELASIIELMVAKDPVVRPSLVEAIAVFRSIEGRFGWGPTQPAFVGPTQPNGLGDLAHQHTVMPGEMTPAPPSLNPPTPVPEPIGGPTPRRSRLPLIGAAVLVAAALVVGIVVWQNRDGDDDGGIADDPTTTVTETTAGFQEPSVPEGIADRSNELIAFLNRDLQSKVRTLTRDEATVAGPTPIGQVFKPDTWQGINAVPVSANYYFENPITKVPPCDPFFTSRITMNGFASFGTVGSTAAIVVAAYSFESGEQASEFFGGRSLQTPVAAPVCEGRTGGAKTVTHDEPTLDTANLRAALAVDQMNSWIWPASTEEPEWLGGGFAIIARRDDVIYEVLIRVLNHRYFESAEISRFINDLLKP